MMLDKLEMAPPDPILGLTEAFKKDPNPKKINLGVGVYKDTKGDTPKIESVRKAEERILASEKSKNYLAITGIPEYGDAVLKLVLGEGHEAIAAGRAVSAQTPGGTGALRVAGDFLATLYPGTSIWLSDPTWENHVNIFQAAGLTVKRYPYYDADARGIAFDKMIAALKEVPQGDVVLLHGCCHNPTGADPTPAQWKEIADVAEARKWMPFVDFAYQGLGDGLDADAVGVRELCRPGMEMLVASSFSKNFGLYNERVGALSVVAASKDAAQKAFSHVKRSIRFNYSNPPSHGASTVVVILNDPALRAQWDDEVKEMRDRINTMRRLFVETLKAKGVERDFSFIERQKGMFSFSGLTPEQVERLRDEFAIYVVRSGRINVAGMTESNMDQLCEAIAAVLK
jgi:aspartate/tyrosine/aromatic aminotransferase